MKNLFNSFFDNKNTTLVGLGIIFTGIGKFLQDKDITSLGMSIVTGIGFILTKDSNQHLK